MGHPADSFGCSCDHHLGGGSGDCVIDAGGVGHPTGSHCHLGNGDDCNVDAGGVG